MTSTPPAAETYRVLSFRQPYASLVVAGRKWCENRTWHTNHRGVLLVHASSRVERAGLEDWPDEMEAAGLDPKNLPTSAIIGAAWLIDCRSIDDSGSEYWQADQATMLRDPVRRAILRHVKRMPATVDYMNGPECWVFSAFYRFPQPIPVKGRLNLWKYDLPAGTLPAEWLAEAVATMEVQEPLP